MKQCIDFEITSKENFRTRKPLGLNSYNFWDFLNYIFLDKFEKDEENNAKDIKMRLDININIADEEESHLVKLTAETFSNETVFSFLSIHK